MRRPICPRAKEWYNVQSGLRRFARHARVLRGRPDLSEVTRLIDAALILEGGAMRSMFTSGVLDVLMEHDLDFAYVIGVSAGALTGVNYISHDIGRTARCNIGFADDSRYIGIGNLLRKRSLFNFDFMFGRMAHTILPMDYDRFEHSKQRFVAVATDTATGEPVYLEKGRTEDMMKAVRASSSMPYLAPMVHIDGMNCLDGGVSDAIPIRRAMAEGYAKRVLVLTRDSSFRASETGRLRGFAIEKTYRAYPRFADKLRTMSARYNRTLDDIASLEKSGDVFILRPELPVTVGRAERDPEKLQALYDEGRRVAEARLEDLKKYLAEPPLEVIKKHLPRRPFDALRRLFKK